VSVRIGTRTATTRSDGTYTMVDLDAGTYSVQPVRSGYRFTPESRQVTIGPDAAGIDFAAEHVYTLSGRVTENGKGLAGVRVNAGDRSTTTGAGGRFNLAGMAAGQYTVTAERSGYTFQPAQAQVTLGPGNASVEFRAIGTYTVKGRVLLNKQGLAGVTVQAGKARAVTNRDGQYELTLSPAGTYSLMPKKAGFRFAPGVRLVRVGPSRSGVNFTASRR
jgi:hypothetical protein